jgi:hypothetical protein
MWHPFKKVILEPITENNIDVPQPIVTLPTEVEKAQLRSLKARTEITMIYERMAENALVKLKGNKHAPNI